jgi:hypothetical protein
VPRRFRAGQEKTKTRPRRKSSGEMRVSLSHRLNLSLMEPADQRPEDHVVKAVAVPKARFGAGEVEPFQPKAHLKAPTQTE